MWAILIQASEEAIDFSTSFASLRHLPMPGESPIDGNRFEGPTGNLG
jgi:hypothetical protein